MNERINEIIIELQEIISMKNLKVNDDTLFSEAVSCWRGEQAGKKYNNQGSSLNNNLISSSPDSRKGNIPVTENQNKFIKANEEAMKKAGFDVDNIQYKSQAIKIIGAFKKLQK